MHCKAFINGLRTTVFIAVSVMSSLVWSQDSVQRTSAKSPQELLAELKDVHLPEPPSLWPLAPGWWVLGLLNVLAVIYLCYKFFFRKPEQPATPAGNNSWRASALREHRRLEAMLNEGVSADQIVSDTSVLLRRIALARRSHESVASVQHDEWLKLLDELSNTDQYSHGVGRLLLEHPYQKNLQLEPQQLSDLLGLVQQTISSRDTVAGSV